MELDTDTKKTLQRGEDVVSMIRSNGWNIVKRDLLGRVTKLRDITLISKEGSPEDIVFEMRVNEKVADQLLEWLKEIEVTPQVHEQNKEVVREMRDEMISRFD